MEHPFIPFPEIKQIRHFTPDVAMTLHGTVKLHGTHADIVKHGDTIVFQSRNRIITPDNDNLGCAAFLSKLDLKPLFETLPKADRIMVCGEFCGGSIQRNVAISKMERMFVVFSVRADKKWLDISDMDFGPIYNIYKFKQFSVHVDPCNMEAALAEIAEYTRQVDSQCPFAAAFGISGPGEGIVWKTPMGLFKSKGEAHCAAKPVVPKKQDVSFPDVVTPARCAQGLEYLTEMGLEISRRNTLAFIEWVIADVLKEESDRLTEFNTKDIRRHVSALAGAWFAQQV